MIGGPEGGGVLGGPCGGLVGGPPAPSAGDTARPQRGQNRLPAGTSPPQATHSMSYQRMRS